MSIARSVLNATSPSLEGICRVYIYRRVEIRRAQSSVAWIGASVLPSTPLLVDVVELVKGFSTSHQRPQADDVVADQLRRALVTGRLTLPRQSFVAAAHGASMASSGTACPQMTPVMEQPQRSASVADAQVHAIHSHHIDFCTKRASGLVDSAGSCRCALVVRTRDGTCSG